MNPRALVTGTLLMVLALIPAARGAGFPSHFDLHYTLSRQGLDIAEVHWQLQPTKNQGFRYSSHTQTIGIAKMFRDEQIMEISDWRFEQGHLQSLHYKYSRHGGKRQREAEAKFDWSQEKLHNNLNGKQWTMPLPAITYDKLNYLLAIMLDLGQDLRVKHYRVATGSKLKTYDLRYLNEESIETAIGPLQCLILERTVKGSERRTRVWAAKTLHFLPVKIEHHEDGETVKLSLTELKALDGYTLMQ